VKLFFNWKIELGRFYQTPIRPKLFYTHGPSKALQELAFWSRPQRHELAKGPEPHHRQERLDLARLGSVGVERIGFCTLPRAKVADGREPVKLIIVFDGQMNARTLREGVNAPPAHETLEILFRWGRGWVFALLGGLEGLGYSRFRNGLFLGTNRCHGLKNLIIFNIRCFYQLIVV
jgi:hypothetical protein